MTNVALIKVTNVALIKVTNVALIKVIYIALLKVRSNNRGTGVLTFPIAWGERSCFRARFWGAMSSFLFNLSRVPGKFRKICGPMGGY